MLELGSFEIRVERVPQRLQFHMNFRGERSERVGLSLGQSPWSLVCAALMEQGQGVVITGKLANWTP
jgi:hypothetical protein